MAISQINANSFASGVPTSSNMPAGSVLQVVKYAAANSGAGGISTTSTTPVSSGITLTITPKKSTSLIRVDFVSSMTYSDVTGPMQIQLWANGANDGSQYSAGYTPANAYYPSSTTHWFLPASTSAQTYTIYFNQQVGGTGYVVHPQSSYSLTATEIAQ